MFKNHFFSVIKSFFQHCTVYDHFDLAVSSHSSLREGGGGYLSIEYMLNNNSSIGPLILIPMTGQFSYYSCKNSSVGLATKYTQNNQNIQSLRIPY